MSDGVFEVLGWAARAVGLFYVMGGLLTLRAARTNSFLDKALAAIEGEPTSAAERLRGWTLWIGGVLTALSGLLLFLLLKAAVAAFLLNAAWQAAYLAWASRALPPTDEAERLGRRRTTNAFAVWLVLTAYVGLLFERGVLT